MPHHIWATDLRQQDILLSDRIGFDRKWLQPLLYAYIPLDCTQILTKLTEEKCQESTEVIFNRRKIPRFDFVKGTKDEQ